MARPLRVLILGFLAGAVGVLVFHQIAVLILHALGVIPFAPYSLEPVPPLGVPRVLSAAFWGGLWGIALAALIEGLPRADRLWVALVFGGILPSLVAALVVTPIKGGDMGRWMQLSTMIVAFVVNGAWGIGTALAYRAGRGAASPTAH